MSLLSDDTDENIDENSSFSSDSSQFSIAGDATNLRETWGGSNKSANVACNLINRQIYGRFTRSPRGKTEKVFNTVHRKCRFSIGSLIRDYDMQHHVFMGFTLCGQFFVSFVERPSENIVSLNSLRNASSEYYLCLWRFAPGKRLKFVSKHRIFKHLKHLEVVDKVMFLQFPTDPYKLICYGKVSTNPALVYITIMTLPFTKSCKYCDDKGEGDYGGGWCAKHGFILHYMFQMAQPCPTFDPHISLAYPNHLVINTGHHIHILNVKSDCHRSRVATATVTKTNDALSEISDTEMTSSRSIVEGFLDDFNEYDLESGNESNKPFHELNISCEPLNVTGKSYNSTGSKYKDYLFSVPTSSGNSSGVKKSAVVDKKTAEKAYEFMEEEESDKCEKLSSFRKKRLAEKKYEFSEDNGENIVPFNSLRRQRTNARLWNRIRSSPDFFLSPKSPRMQSPLSSPRGYVYCPSLTRKSPVSPRESARKFYLYSPSLDSDCSDSDSRLILKQSISSCINHHISGGLLIIDPKKASPKWIKKVVRRFSNGDFENSSLLSGQSRDDYNTPIEVPLLVNTLNEQHLDLVPEFRIDQVNEMQLIVSQRTFDCEQFVHQRAQKLCAESHLEFLHCEDYDIKINYICPINGHIICQAVIILGALEFLEPYTKPKNYTAHCVFAWNLSSDSFDVIEPPDGEARLQPSDSCKAMPHLDVPKAACKQVLVMDYCCSETKSSLRDYNNLYKVYLDEDEYYESYNSGSD